MIHSHIYYSSVKRSILIIALLCAVLMQATAQNRYKNEIAVTYAPLSNYDLQGQILLQIDKTISDKIDVQIPGSFGIEYFRHLGDLVSVGGIGSIYYFASQPEGMHKFSYINYALMAGVKLHWYERNGSVPIPSSHLEPITSARTLLNICISAFSLRFWVWKSARGSADS